MAVRQSSFESNDLVLPLLIEDIAVSRRSVETAVVRVATVTHTRDQLVTEPLVHERIEVEHVPVGRFVEATPPVREDDDVTIMPVMEEVIVIERRLFLKEEVHTGVFGPLSGILRQSIFENRRLSLPEPRLDLDPIRQPRPLTPIYGEQNHD